MPSGLFLTFVLATCALNSAALAWMQAAGLGKGTRAGLCWLEGEGGADPGVDSMSQS